jgi:acetyl esterase/lipase
MIDPECVNPFVLPIEARAAERHGSVDLYLPDATRPRPAVVFAHGGPRPAGLLPTPRDWPVFRGYGSVAAARGMVGVTVDHRLHDPAGYPLAADDVAAAVELARADPRVDADRVAVWFFSGGGLLLADWLRDPPPWLRCVAATYPMLAPPPGWPADPRFQPAEAVAAAGALPIVLTRVGRENPFFAATVDAFVAAASACAARLEVIDVPDGQHGFDYLDHTEQSSAAVERALDLVFTALTGPGQVAVSSP